MLNFFAWCSYNCRSCAFTCGWWLIGHFVTEIQFFEWKVCFRMIGPAWSRWRRVIFGCYELQLLTCMRLWGTIFELFCVRPCIWFAHGIESRQSMHSWIACYPRKGGKLLRSDFFLEIDVIFAFLWSIYPTFWQPNWGRISSDNRITLRAGRALRVIFVTDFFSFCHFPNWAKLGARGKPSTMFTARNDS